MYAPTLTLPFYTIVTFKGEHCIARCNGRQWEFDRTSDVINEMLRNGLVDLDTIQYWIDTRSPALLEK